MGFVRSWQFAAGFVSAIGLITGTVVIGSAIADKQAPVSGRGASFTCTPVKLWDGDGPIHCAEGPKVRLAGIAAREMDGTCKQGHPCPKVSAKQSRDHLAALLIGNPPLNGINFSTTGHIDLAGAELSCVSAGSAGGNRTAAWCVSPFVGDLSCRMVRDGYALKWPRYWRGHRC